MKKETKTWPALMEQETNSQRSNLIVTAEGIIDGSLNCYNRKTWLSLSGIPLELDSKNSAQIIRSRLSQEQEEYLSMCKKYNHLGLEREAIVKTKLFNSTIRKVDIHKDLFTFGTFDEDGNVLANLKNLRTSEEFFRLINKLELYIWNCSEESPFKVKVAAEFLSEIINQMKDDFWPKRSDVEKSASMRRISITFPAAPQRVKNRIIDWYEKGFIPKVIAHREAITPVVPSSYFGKIHNLISQKISKFEELQKDISALEDFRSQIDGFTTKGKEGDDPIFFIEDGIWTIIVDQYATFPKEQEVIDVIKDHYNLLGIKYGILQQKN